MLSNRLDAYRVYLILAAAQSAAFTLVFTVNLVYQVETVRLNPLQLVLVGTALEATAFLFEVPTGVVADTYSRRASVIISMFLTGTAFLVEGSFPTFAGVVLGQMLWGVGWTFTSGALQAWVADELGEEAAGRAYVRASQMDTLAYIPAVLVSVALGIVRLNLPILVGGGAFIALGVFLLLFMPEQGFIPTPREDRTSFQHMAHTFTQGLRVVRGRPTLVTILIIGVIYGAFSEGFDRLWTAHLLANFTFPSIGSLEPVVWIGALGIVSAALSLGPQEVIARRLDLTSYRAVTRALLIINLLLVVAVIGFALAPTLAAALAVLVLVKQLLGLDGPLRAAWINQRLDPQVRATVLSMAGQVDALGQVGGGPVLGAIGLRMGLRAALAAAGVMLSPALALYASTQRQSADALAVETR